MRKKKVFLNPSVVFYEGLPLGGIKLTLKQLDDLPEYRTWIPSYHVIGRRWKSKRKDGDGWLLAEMVELDGRLEILWRAIEIDATAEELEERRWRPMSKYPARGIPPRVRVKMRDGTIRPDAHHAEGGGEDQPPFKGWFVPCGDGFVGIDDPVAWMPKEEHDDAVGA